MWTISRSILCFFIWMIVCFMHFGCRGVDENASRSEKASFPEFELNLAKKLNFPDSGLYIQDHRDGQIYRIVKIGTQLWMAENLNFSSEGSWCYRDSSVYCEKRGRLYNWKAAKEACPKGWRLPSNDDWSMLREYVISNSREGCPSRRCPSRSCRCAGYKLKKNSGWQMAVDVPAGSDEFGFSGVPGGMRLSDGSFGGLNDHSYLWSATEADSVRSFVWDLWYNANVFYESFEQKMGKDGNKDNGFSVRCIKD